MTNARKQNAPMALAQKSRARRGDSRSRVIDQEKTMTRSFTLVSAGLLGVTHA